MWLNIEWTLVKRRRCLNFCKFVRKFLPRSRQSTRASEYRASFWTTNDLSSSSWRPEAVQFGSCASTFSSDLINFTLASITIFHPLSSVSISIESTPSSAHTLVFCLPFVQRTHIESHIFQHLRSSNTNAYVQRIQRNYVTLLTHRKTWRFE